ncbi:MAG: chorismate mutase, partial [Clostridia bacterium]|nr:chorismate mutase [Clostridia bacterium]
MDLNPIRARIDVIDDQITDLLVQRMKVVEDIAAAKKAGTRVIRDHARERSIINRVTKISGDTYAPYVRDLYKLMFELSCNYQSSVMGYVSPLDTEISSAIAECTGKKFP